MSSQPTFTRRRARPLLRVLLKLTRVFDYEGEIRMAVAAGPALPVIEIVPLEEISASGLPSPLGRGS